MLAGASHSFASVSAPPRPVCLRLLPAASPVTEISHEFTRVFPACSLQDVYSFAVVLWELATFQPPWDESKNPWQASLLSTALPVQSAFSCPTGKKYFGHCSAPYSTHRKACRPPMPCIGNLAALAACCSGRPMVTQVGSSLPAGRHHPPTCAISPAHCQPCACLPCSARTCKFSASMCLL